MDPRELAASILRKHVGGVDINAWVGLLAQAGVAEPTIVKALRIAAGGEGAFAKELERGGVRVDIVVETHRAAGGSGITADDLRRVSTGGLGFAWLPHGSPNWTSFYGRFR